MSESELRNHCLDKCEDALEKPGTIGEYTPDEKTLNNQSVELGNDQQAAAWMDCIAETSCDNLADGYCAPVW